MKKEVGWGALGFVLLTLLVWQLWPAPQAKLPAGWPQYLVRLQLERQAKDNWLRTAKDSPIPALYRNAFPGLNYYPPAPGFRLAAMFGAGTDTGSRQAGIVSFAYRGRTYHLNAEWEPADSAGARQLFIAFRDSTSGHETYGGGRYLNIPLPHKKQNDTSAGADWVIDFNTAYNPYCVYNHDYVCPVPPPANKLPFAVYAGERSINLDSAVGG